jgi:hypothetical protein
MAPPWEMPKGRRRLPGGLTGNALVSGVVSAIVAGVISFTVVHYQDQDAARQAQASQQVQEAEQVETAANSFYQATMSVYNFQLKCVSRNETSQQCEILAPGDNDLATADNALDADMLNITDREAFQLAASLLSASAWLLSSVTAVNVRSEWKNVVVLYFQLIFRCGQLIQGYQ